MKYYTRAGNIVVQSCSFIIIFVPMKHLLSLYYWFIEYNKKYMIRIEIVLY